MIRFAHHVQFVTITNLNWLPVLQNDYHKQIIIEALQYRVAAQQVTIYAFVIMPNHIHLLWKISHGLERKDVEGALFSFTAHEFKRSLKKNNPMQTEKHLVNKSDREYHPDSHWEGDKSDVKGMLYEEIFNKN